MPGSENCTFCELAWTDTSLSSSLGCEEGNFYLTEVFSPRKPRILFLLSPADSL